MALQTSSDSQTWSSDIATTTDTLVQCQAGNVCVTTDTSAAIGDGLILAAGQMIVIPGGASFKWAPLNSVTSTLWYEETGV